MSWPILYTHDAPWSYSGNDAPVFTTNLNYATGTAPAWQTTWNEVERGIQERARRRALARHRLALWARLQAPRREAAAPRPLSAPRPLALFTAPRRREPRWRRGTTHAAARRMA